jgi:hypothetical protein
MSEAEMDEMGEMTAPEPTLEELYQQAIQEPADPALPPADIWEHLPLLRQLASKCDHVTEFGVREGLGSTVAFLAAQPRVLISWDVNPNSIVSQRIADLIWRAGKTSFQPRVGSTLEIPPIESTDLLFIDTIHDYAHLKAELEIHADPVRNAVRKYLVFHDTVTFGEVSGDGTRPGLRAAIRWFQRCHAFPLWQLKEDRQNCNGLVVLERIDVKE